METGNLRVWCLENESNINEITLAQDQSIR